jgi:glutamine synthetase
VAKVLCDMAGSLESSVKRGEDFPTAVAAVIKDTLTAHKRIIYNGNGYSQEWLAEAARRGLSNLRTTVESCEVLTSDKSVELFTRFGVLSSVELHARQEILLENYAKVLNIEAQTMIEMATRDILPAVNAYVTELANSAATKTAIFKTADVSMEADLVDTLSRLVGEAFAAVKALKAADASACACTTGEAMACAFAEQVIPAMQHLRTKVDEMESLTSSDYWPLPTYGDMMFRI